jgi:hypothetical protein
MRLKVPASNPVRGVAGMLKKYVSKFAMDILPSVAATIIGAYIVNHYIVTKPGAYAPVAAAVSPADPKKADSRNEANPSGTSAVANIPEPGVKARGISEKAMIEKSAAEQPATAERPADKSADKPAETASIPVETRRHPAPREKAVAKTVPAPAVPVVAAPVVAAPNTVPPVEAAIAPDERRDANDLARAAIERLRGAGDGSPRAQEAARAADTPRVPDTARLADAPRVVSAPAASAPNVRPLPPPIMVSTPRAETLDGSGGSSQVRQPYPGSPRIDDPSRPIPPADIPGASTPLDLRAEAVEPARREHTTVAQDVLSAAKSMFHAVLPKNTNLGSD